MDGHGVTDCLVLTRVPAAGQGAAVPQWLCTDIDSGFVFSFAQSVVINDIHPPVTSCHSRLRTTAD